MKARLLDKNASEVRQIELPENFSAPVRSDVILKVFESQKRKQAFGNYVEAGKRHSASGILRRKRHSWKVTYGKGISRTPRKIMSRDGASFNWVGAEAANTRGGRRAHPPKSWENFERKVNKKELILAMNGALTATTKKEILAKKFNQEIKANLPIIFSNEILALKTSDFIDTIRKAFDKIEGLLQVRKVRAGKGKMRGRKYRKSAGLLFIVASDEKMKRKGIDVVQAKNIAMKDLAPNGQPGRFVAFTEKSIKELGEKFK